MKEMTAVETELVSGAMTTQTKVIIAIALASPAIGAMVALGYFANNDC